jgi:hypothetical protein
MSRIAIVILIYHRHKHTDLTKRENSRYVTSYIPRYFVSGNVFDNLPSN